MHGYCHTVHAFVISRSIYNTYICLNHSCDTSYAVYGVILRPKKDLSASWLTCCKVPSFHKKVWSWLIRDIMVARCCRIWNMDIQKIYKILNLMVKVASWMTKYWMRWPRCNFGEFWRNNIISWNICKGVRTGVY